jgi:hypothetical protein
MVVIEGYGNAEAKVSVCHVGGHRFHIADIVAADRDEVLRLFVAAFGFMPDAAWYAWKYVANRGQAIGLWDETGRLVAHYAGVPRELRWQGRAINAIQIGDVMVAPEVRGILTRKGPFFQVCSRFFADRIGSERAYRMAFGFPNDRHIRLGVALDLYYDEGPIHLVSWPAKHQDLPWRWRWSRLAEGNTLARQVDRAWQSMALDLSDHVLGVRDAEYLHQRFFSRPDREYQIFCLRHWPFGGVAGVAVMRFEQDRAELLDLIGSRAVLLMLVRAAVAEAERVGALVLTAWVSPAVLAALYGTGGEVGGKVANLAVAKVSALNVDEVTSARWWWMGGDTDFL